MVLSLKSLHGKEKKERERLEGEADALQKFVMGYRGGGGRGKAQKTTRKDTVKSVVKKIFTRHESNFKRLESDWFGATERCAELKKELSESRSQHEASKHGLRELQVESYNKFTQFRKHMVGVQEELEGERKKNASVSARMEGGERELKNSVFELKKEVKRLKEVVAATESEKEEVKMNFNNELSAQEIAHTKRVNLMGREVEDARKRANDAMIKLSDIRGHDNENTRDSERKRNRTDSYLEEKFAFGGAEEERLICEKIRMISRKLMGGEDNKEEVSEACERAKQVSCSNTRRGNHKLFSNTP